MTTPGLKYHLKFRCFHFSTGLPDERSKRLVPMLEETSSCFFSKAIGSAAFTSRLLFQGYDHFAAPFFNEIPISDLAEKYKCSSSLKGTIVEYPAVSLDGIQRVTPFFRLSAIACRPTLRTTVSS